jgi:hypothetical protein
MSLQEYILGRLTEVASSPTLEEVLDQAGSLSGGEFSFSETVSLLHPDRGSC